jgi:hypothetical protein
MLGGTIKEGDTVIVDVKEGRITIAVRRPSTGAVAQPEEEAEAVGQR